MKLLVVEIPSSLVIDAEYMIMHLSDPVDSSVYPFSHFKKKPSSCFRSLRPKAEVLLTKFIISTRSGRSDVLNLHCCIMSLPCAFFKLFSA